MTSTVATLRSELAAALANDGVWSVFSFPPASPIANSVIVQPDDPYISPTNNDWNIDPTVNFKVTMVVPLFDNQGNLNGIEEFMTAVFLKISAWNVGVAIYDFGAPVVLGTDAGQMLAADVTLKIVGKWS